MLLVKRTLINLVNNIAIFTFVGFCNLLVNPHALNVSSFIEVLFVGTSHGLLLTLVESALNRTTKKLNPKGLGVEFGAAILAISLSWVVSFASSFSFETVARLTIINGLFRIFFLIVLDLNQPVVTQQPSNKQKAFITGCGRALPGVDQMKGKGALIDLQIIMDQLIKHGIHNPVTGKPVSSDFGHRNLGLKTLPIADLKDFQTGFPEYKNPDNAASTGEIELCRSAIQQAMEGARVEAKDLDAIIHVSPTFCWLGADLDHRGKSWGLQNCMRKYAEWLPGLRSECLIQHHDSGCSGVLVPFKIAKPMLTSGECKHILVVCSEVGPRGESDFWTKKNELDIWVNYVLFGDSACAFVLSASEDPSEVVNQTRDKICYELGRVSTHTKTDFYIAERLIDHVVENGEVKIKLGLRLNPHAAKKVFVQELYEWLASENYEDDQIDALLLHQPNTAVIKFVEDRFGKKVLNIADRYGNLVPCSLGVQFYEQLVLQTRLKTGNFIVGFTLGAHAGMTYGGFCARVHADDQYSSGPKNKNQ